MLRLQNRPAPPGTIRLPGGKWTAILLAAVGFISTVCTIVLSLFPAEDDTNPRATLIKIVVMTFVLLAGGVAVYLWSNRARRGVAHAVDASTL